MCVGGAQYQFRLVPFSASMVRTSVRLVVAGMMIIMKKMHKIIGNHMPNERMSVSSSAIY